VLPQRELHRIRKDRSLAAFKHPVQRQTPRPWTMIMVVVLLADKYLSSPA
jgi:hypothetical protein